MASRRPLERRPVMDVGGTIYNVPRRPYRSNHRKCKIQRHPRFGLPLFTRPPRIFLRSRLHYNASDPTIASRGVRRPHKTQIKPASDNDNSTPAPSRPLPITGQRGVSLPSLPVEAILALILSINIRILLGNGADALLKVAAQKAITFLMALLLASLLRYLEDLYPPFLIMEETNDVRSMAGIVSGWFGQCAGESVGYRLELRIGEWLSRRQNGRNNLRSLRSDGFETLHHQILEHPT